MIYYRKFDDDKERNYTQYVEKQGGKISYKAEAIISAIPQRVIGFRRLFRSHAKDLMPGRMLCLGVRTGCEVQGAREVGYLNSIGIDLHPIGPHVGDTVIQGDMHKLKPLFPEDTFMNAYTNSLDHCYDLPAVIQGLKHVLKNNGVFFFQLMHKMALDWALLEYEMTVDAYMASRAYDTMFWNKSEDILNEFKKEGFVLVKTWGDNKWYSCIIRCKK